MMNLRWRIPSGNAKGREGAEAMITGNIDMDPESKVYVPTVLQAY
jgi:hypothetical protein